MNNFQSSTSMQIYNNVCIQQAQRTQDVESMLILTLVPRLRRWTNVKPTLIQRLVSAGKLLILTLPSQYAPLHTMANVTIQMKRRDSPKYQGTQPGSDKDPLLWRKSLLKKL